MHELGITQNILDTVLEHAARAGATRVTRVNLVLGDLADVTEESIRFYWEVIARGTPAEGANLAFQRVPVRLRCAHCGTVFTPAEECAHATEELVEAGAHHGDLLSLPDRWRCPRCGRSSLDVLAGREFHLESIEVDG